MVNNVTLEDMVSSEDMSIIMPYMEMYNHIMSCKNLGLQVNADTLTPEDLDFLLHIQNETEKANEARNKRKNK